MKHSALRILLLLTAFALLPLSGANAAKLWESDFVTKGLEQFLIQDIHVEVNPDYFQPPSSAPSAWKVQNGALNQNSNIYANPDDTSQETGRYQNSYTGTAAVVKDFSAQDGIFYMQFRTSDNDGTGLVFRYVDEKNYLRFYSMIDAGNGGPVTRIEKWVDGAFEVLAIIPDTDAGQPVEEGVVYKQNVRETMLCTATGQDIACYLGDLNQPVLTAKDPTPKAGTFGVSLYANQLDITTLTALSPGSSLFVATINDTAGAPINGVWVSLLKDGQSVDGGYTNPAGQVVFLDHAAGAYQISVGGAMVTTVPDQNASITAGVGSGAFTFDVKPTEQILDLSTASGFAWKAKVPTTAAEDYSSPTDPETGFDAIDVPSDWTQSFENGLNTFGWLRTKVAIPAANVGKDLVLTDWYFDDDETTYWNGTPLGATTGVGTLRSYVIPGEMVKAENTLAIRGYNGGGPGGITGATPKLRLTNPGVTIKGTVKDPNGAPLSGVRVIAFSPGTKWGPQNSASITDANGVFIMAGLAPGAYTVSREARFDLDPDAAQTVSVSGDVGQTLAADFVTTMRPSAILGSANGYNWKINYGTSPGDDFTPVNANVSAFGEITVPQDLESQGLGDDMNLYWYRVAFTLPDAMKAMQGRDLVLRDFVVADADITYFNGQKIGQTGALPTDPADPANTGYVGDWTTPRVYTIPSAIVNWTGENVLVVRAYHESGGSGIRGNAPVLVVAPGAVVVVKPGDLNGDGKINVQDATLSLRIAVGLLTPDDKQKEAGDVNNDGKWNIQDTTLILQVAVGNKPASDLK